MYMSVSAHFNEINSPISEGPQWPKFVVVNDTVLGALVFMVAGTPIAEKHCGILNSSAAIPASGVI